MTIQLPEQQHCGAILDQVLKASDDISAVMLALRDGRPFVERHRATLEAGKFAAMSSSLAALGHSVLRELGAGTLDHVLVDGSMGKLVVSSVPGSNGVLILAVLARHGARLGLVLGYSKMCAQEIGSSLQRHAPVTA